MRTRFSAVVHIRRRTHADAHTPNGRTTRAVLHARTHTRTHAPTHLRTHAPTHACTHARTHSRMHARTHARTRTHLVRTPYPVQDHPAARVAAAPLQTLPFLPPTIAQVAAHRQVWAGGGSGAGTVAAAAAGDLKRYTFSVPFSHLCALD